MNSPLRLLVVTATRGSSPFWKDTVDSVQAVAVQMPTQHVVVCPEDTKIAVGEEAPLARLITQASPGLYPNLNHGWRAADNWDVFTWINDDDVMQAEGILAGLQLMAAEPGLDFVYGRVAMIDREGRRLGEVPLARTPADLSDLMQQGIMPLAQPGTLIRRAALEQLNGVDESFAITGDLDLFARACAAGMRYACSNAPCAAFRLQAGQLSKRVEEVAAENRRSLSHLAAVTPTRSARWRFRLQNLSVYAERFRRHGFKSMRQIYDEVQ